MQSINSDLLPIKLVKKKSVLENRSSKIQNILDILEINNDLYHFLYNPFLNYKKKCFFLYIIFHIEYFDSKIIKLIQFKFTDIKKKSCIPYTFIRLWNKKKKWGQINIITAIPLSYYIEEYIIFFLKNSDIKYFLKKKVNNSIIGGLILRIEDKEFNISLEEKIKKLRIQLKNYI